MSKDKRMTKQVRVYDDTAHAISVIASSLSKQRGEEVTFADIVDECVQKAFPETYDLAISTLSKAEQESKQPRKPKQ